MDRFAMVAAKVRAVSVPVAVILALASPLVFMAGGLGARFGLWDWSFGLGTVTRDWGPKVCFAAIGLCVVVLITGFLGKPRGGRVVAAVALILPIAALMRLDGVQAVARAHPIHDVTTNTADPPKFSPAMAQARGPEANPTGYAGKTVRGEGSPTVAAITEELYPDLHTLIFAADPHRVFLAAKTQAKELGWEIVTADEADGRVEATATTFWYGFKDDVVVRIRPGPEGGSAVDIRSLSRVGRSDLGANVKRIREFKARLRGRVLG
ncbi:MAG: DUF1499 domain-containing protein [Maricaulaceae bacterium]